MAQDETNNQEDQAEAAEETLTETLDDSETLLAVILAAIADEDGFDADSLHEVLIMSGKEGLWEEAQLISEEDEQSDGEEDDDPEVDDILRELEEDDDEPDAA